MSQESNHRLPLPVSQWTWIHRGTDASTVQVCHPRHQEWMKDHQHQHSHREILAVLQGPHFYGAWGTIYRASPGTVFLIESGELHDHCYSPYQPPCRDLWVVLSSPRQAVLREIVVQRHDGGEPSGADFRQQSCSRRMVLSSPLVEAVTESWNRYRAEQASPVLAAQLSCAVAALLLHVTTIIRLQNERHASATEHRHIIESIKEYVVRHPGDDLSVSALARLAGYAPTYFHRLFLDHTGEQLRRFVNRVRLNHAQKLLAEGRSVQSVAEDLGFGTAAYFSRFFKQATGYSPGWWKTKSAFKKENGSRASRF